MSLEGFLFDNAINSFNKQMDEHIAKDNSDSVVQRMANDLNMKLDDTTKDYLLQYYLNEQSNRAAFNRQMDASNTQYQRAVADLKAAGLNPFLAIQSLQGSSPSSSGQSVQGGLYTSRSNTKANNTAANAQRIMMVLGIVAAAVIAAL